MLNSAFFLKKNSSLKLTKTMPNKKLIDSGAGFFLDEEDLIEEQNKKVTELPRM